MNYFPIQSWFSDEIEYKKICFRFFPTGVVGGVGDSGDPGRHGLARLSAMGVPEPARCSHQPVADVAVAPGGVQGRAGTVQYQPGGVGACQR